METAVCYIAFVLTEQGDSYGTALTRFIEKKYAHIRLSQGILKSALDFLVKERVIRGYCQAFEGRGRSRKMYQVCATQLEQARALALLWRNYVGQSQRLD